MIITILVWVGIAILAVAITIAAIFMLMGAGEDDIIDRRM